MKIFHLRMKEMKIKITVCCLRPCVSVKTERNGAFFTLLREDFSAALLGDA